MRKIALLAAAFAAITGASALHAQGNGGPPPGGRGRGPGGRGGPGAGAMMDRALLNGINLTDTQKAQLEQLREADRAQMQANGEANRSEMEAIRTARQNGDSATLRNLMQAQRTKMDARRDQQVSAIRGILSSDQLAQFDANVADMKKREAEMGPGMRGRGPRPPQA